MEGPQVVGRGRLDPVDRADGGAAPGVGVVAAAEFEDDLRAGVVLDAPGGPGSPGRGSARPRRRSSIGRRTTSAKRPSAGTRFRPRVAAESVVWAVWAPSEWETPRLSRAPISSRLSRSPAPRVIHSLSIEAVPLRSVGLERGAGGEEEGERRRADRRDRLGDEDQAVVESVAARGSVRAR